MGFGSDVAAWGRKFDINGDRLVRSVVIGLGSAIIDRNPVGTPLTTGVAGYQGGRSKGNWQYGLNVIPVTQTEVRDPDGGLTKGQLAIGVPARAAGHVHYVANNVEYIEDLERGTSQQAPAGMLAVTVNDFQAMVRQIAAQVVR